RIARLRWGGGRGERMNMIALGFGVLKSNTYDDQLQMLRCLWTEVIGPNNASDVGYRIFGRILHPSVVSNRTRFPLRNRFPGNNQSPRDVLSVSATTLRTDHSELQFALASKQIAAM
ncbi:hypothetical protein BaRGS_00018378, partial [Batillaria attramentaria]